MAARTSAWLVWALLAGSIVFWGLRLGVAPQGLPEQVRTVGAEQASRGDILRLFANPSDLGATPPAEQAAAASRLKLMGVVAGGVGSGWAMLSIDGLPTRMIRVGGQVTADWVVLSVSTQLVEVGPIGGPPAARLDLPLPAAPATGVMAGAPFAADPVAPRAAVAPPAMDAPPPPPTVVLGEGGSPVPPSEAPPPPPR
jgi:general secretion pathway protein C